MNFCKLFSDCSDLTNSASAYVKITDSSGAVFNDIATYSCDTNSTQSAIFVDGTPMNESEYSRRCMYDATWSDEVNTVSCFFCKFTQVCSIYQIFVFSKFIL